LTTVNAAKTEATATVPAIPTGEDPPFQLFNPAKSASALAGGLQDGGLSEPKFFFSSKANIVIRAENKKRKYGISNPAFTVQVFRDDVLVTSPDSLAKYKLDGINDITYKTNAKTFKPRRFLCYSSFKNY
jgi:hypothetical protein